MCGLKDDGSYETPAESITGRIQYINACIADGNLAHAIHAAQDLATPAHRGHIWDGGLLGIPSLSHIWGDIFPSQGTLNEAVANTREVLDAHRDGRQAVFNY